MRGRGLFIGFVVLNVAFAGALIYFVTRSGSSSSTPPPPATLSSLPNPAATNPPPTPQPAASISTGTVVATESVTRTNTTTNVVISPPAPFVAGKQYGWQDIESTNYLGYLDNLRKVGCPEPMVRQIIFHDANELFNQRRLQAAITNDFNWWQG